jgi:hypothetical protein
MNAMTLFVSAILLFAAVPETPARAADKITICHIDEVTDLGLLGTVIRISVEAWPAHERHFDYETPGLAVGDVCGIIE